MRDDLAERVGALSERERATLRLLLAGHDAKSAARALELSVHTVNERLREARRKLGVSSSREAARCLAQTEGVQPAPKFLGDEEMRVASEAGGVEQARRSITRPGWGAPLVWAAGGMLMMALVAVAVAVGTIVGGGHAPHANAGPAAAVQSVPETGEAKAARAWLDLLDRQQWDESWTRSGTAFRSMPKEKWATTGQHVRQPLGAVSSRVLQSVTKSTALPGAPPGEYQVFQFRTVFAGKADSVETVVMSREPDGWRVNGYFIR